MHSWAMAKSTCLRPFWSGGVVKEAISKALSILRPSPLAWVIKYWAASSVMLTCSLSAARSKILRRSASDKGLNSKTENRESSAVLM